MLGMVLSIVDVQLTLPLLTLLYCNITIIIMWCAPLPTSKEPEIINFQKKWFVSHNSLTPDCIEILQFMKPKAL